MPRSRGALAGAAACGFVIALLAVLGMSWLVAQVDHVPVLPQELRDWREFLEYAASVGLSFLSGLVVGKILRERLARQRLAVTLGKGKESALKAQVMAIKLNELLGTLIAVGTSVLSIYTGLKGVLG